jgi:hypothetical protein
MADLLIRDVPDEVISATPCSGPASHRRLILAT